MQGCSGGGGDSTSAPSVRCTILAACSPAWRKKFRFKHRRCQSSTALVHRPQSSILRQNSPRCSRWNVLAVAIDPAICTRSADCGAIGRRGANRLRAGLAMLARQSQRTLMQINIGATSSARIACGRFDCRGRIGSLNPMRMRW